MKLAIPTAQGRLTMHFGHCEKFTLIDVDENKNIVHVGEMTPPPHEPGVLPAWLHQQGVNVIVAGGMGQRARMIFAEKGIQVVTGAQPDTPESVVKHYLQGTLTTGDNPCDH